MAKFANVTYGTHGDTKAYTYVVNDNVRTGDFLHPSVKHKISGKIFGTTGIVQSMMKEDSVRGQQKKQELESKGIKAKNAYTGKEVGAAQERNESGQFSGGGMGRTVKNMETGMRQGQRDFVKSQYVEQTRQANIARREAQETYESYSENYKNNGGK